MTGAACLRLAAAIGPGTLGLAAALLVVGAAIVYGRRHLPRARRQREERRRHDGLAAANGLTASEANWLWQLSAAARLERPSHLFVRPTVFDDLVAARGDQQALAQAVRAKLFDGPLAES